MLLGPAGMVERLGHGEVGVGQLDVLAHQGDLEAGLGSLDALHEAAPGREVGRVDARLEVQQPDHEVAQTPLLEEQRHLVDRVGGGGRHDGIDVDVAEEGDLLAQVVIDRPVAAGDDDVGLDADAAQLLDRVLRRLRLQLAGRGESGQQRDVDVEDVVAADVLAHLADGLEEGQRLDVADGAADLDDDDVRAAVSGDASDALLDLVGDVGDDLDRAAQEVAAALLGDDGLVDAPRRDVGELA